VLVEIAAGLMTALIYLGLFGAALWADRCLRRGFERWSERVDKANAAERAKPVREQSILRLR
jgi:hypothetical protein